LCVAGRSGSLEALGRQPVEASWWTLLNDRINVLPVAFKPICLLEVNEDGVDTTDRQAGFPGDLQPEVLTFRIE